MLNAAVRSSFLFVLEAVFYVLHEQCYLVCVQSASPETGLFPRELWVHYWLDATVNHSLQYLQRDTVQRDGSVGLGVFAGLLGFSRAMTALS